MSLLVVAIVVFVIAAASVLALNNLICRYEIERPDSFELRYVTQRSMVLCSGGEAIIIVAVAFF